MPAELYHNEWERRRLRNSVHLTIGGCLGACALANVVEVIFAGRTVFFHSIDRDEQVLAIYDYLEQMVAAESYLPPPPALTPYQFTAVEWEGRADGLPVETRRAKRTGERPGFLFLTHADTDLLALGAALDRLPPEFPPVRAYNLLNLATPADIDAFLDLHLPNTDVAVVRVHGGRASFEHGFDRLVREAEARGLWLLALPGVGGPDPELTALSNAGVPVLHQALAYLQEGGPANLEHAFRFLADHLLTTGFDYDPPKELPRHGVYHPDVPEGTAAAWQARRSTGRPAVGLLFYRAHLLSGNTAFVDAMVRAGERAGLDVLPVYLNSLKDGGDGPGGLPAPLALFHPETGVAVDAIISTLSFAMGGVNPDGPTEAGWGVEAFTRLGVPVFQAITVAGPRDRWAASSRGLPPVEAAMNVVLPEFDGRIGTVPVSFKEAVPSIQEALPLPQRERAQPMREATAAPGASPPAVPASRYVPDEERIDRLFEIVRRAVTLRRKPNAEKRVAVVLTNSTARISRIGNAVGLDAPASLLRLLERMRGAGYRVGELPPDGDTLIHDLIARCSYDVEYLTDEQLAQAARVPDATYARWLAELPEESGRGITGRWGPPPGEAYVHDGALALAGIPLGKVFVALQPPRGYGMDPNAIYHMPDLPPPHYYHALYRWLRDPHGWNADAIIHLGKHGTLEWLPGKAVAPAGDDYPDAFLAGLPLIYPFIINDPGEGTQAKRRAHAVIVDHMTPPMTAAGSYGDLAELAQLVDEYYQVELLDPAKLPVLQRQIWDLVVRAHLDSDIAAVLNRNAPRPEDQHPWDPTLTDEGAPATMENMRGKDMAHLIQEIDGYLCELAGAQIRDGLHILGTVPEGEQLVELLAQLVRLPNLDVPSLREAVATAYGLSLSALLDEPGARLADTRFATAADAVAEIDAVCLMLLRGLLERGFDPDAAPDVTLTVLEHANDGSSKRPPVPSLRDGPTDQRQAPSLKGGSTDQQRTAELRDGSSQQPPVPGLKDGSTYQSPALGRPAGRGDASASAAAGPGEHPQPLRQASSGEPGGHPSGTIAGDKGSATEPGEQPYPVQPASLGSSGGHPAGTIIDDNSGAVRAATNGAAGASEPRAGDPSALPPALAGVAGILRWVCEALLPRLRETEAEIDAILQALDGRYIPAGPSGAPTRGMAHVLPTGRNFYAVDPRAMPSAAAWQVGQELADALLRRYLDDEGRYPETVGLSIWGTSAMRTHGDDIAEVFALLGVRPCWQPDNHRLAGVEVVPLHELGRPRIDVVCRISGFFRDAFPGTVAVIDQAVRTVAALHEPDEQNFVRKHVRAERTRLERTGMEPGRADERARYRVFGSKPGSYGAGILPLIDERHWQTTADFAEAYLAWGGYAYTATEYGVEARSEFEGRLAGVQVAAKNQDNREHDIFDSDDYLQYHGGMIATIRSLTGANPRRYFGDSADPSRPRVRDLKEEALRVFRSRVVNPKWLAGIQRHGYKGGLELAATVDYLFGYDATADVLDDWVYERLTEAYLKDQGLLDFLQRSNPWALHDIASRLLEAVERGLWMDPTEEALWVIKDVVRRKPPGRLPSSDRSEARSGPQTSPGSDKATDASEDTG